MDSVPTKTLPSGDEIPMIGFGTWDLSGETVKSSVRAALESGYTHIDTAEGYKNESEIGTVLTEYDRSDIFLTSKVLPKNLDYESVVRACRASLERLGTDYLDLYLIHWPNPAISLRETLNAMETVYDEGLVKNIGVSNFSAYQLSCAKHISDVPIAVNQIEYHPLYQQPRLREYCSESDTVVEAAAPLARTKILDEPAICKIADDHDRSPAAVVLRWAIARDTVVLPKSTSPSHIESNLTACDWDLPEGDLAVIDELNRHEPVYHQAAYSWARDVYGISE
jgi:diketogulonate reductase-like aldo/keto reductase